MQELNVNFARMTVVEAERVSTGRERLVCQTGDDEEEPTHFCQDCNLLLCEHCTNSHRRSMRFKDHALVSVDEFKRRGQAVPKLKRMCKKHKDKELDLYCSTCHALICQHCTVKEHKDHDIDLLVEVAQDHVGKLEGEAAEVAQLQARLEEEISCIKAEEVALRAERKNKRRSSTHTLSTWPRCWRNASRS